MKPLLLTISPRLYPTSPASSRSQRRVASNLSSPANRDIQSALCGRCRTTGARWFGASGRWPNCRTSRRALGSVLLGQLSSHKQDPGPPEKKKSKKESKSCCGLDTEAKELRQRSLAAVDSGHLPNQPWP